MIFLIVKRAWMGFCFTNLGQGHNDYYTSVQDDTAKGFVLSAILLFFSVSVRESV